MNLFYHVRVTAYSREISAIESLTRCSYPLQMKHWGRNLFGNFEKTFLINIEEIVAQ